MLLTNSVTKETLVINDEVNDDVGWKVNWVAASIEGGMESNAASCLQRRLVEAVTEAANQTDDIHLTIGSEDDFDHRIAFDVIGAGLLRVDGIRFKGDPWRRGCRETRSLGMPLGSRWWRAKLDGSDGGIILGGHGACTAAQLDSADGADGVVAAIDVIGVRRA